MTSLINLESLPVAALSQATIVLLLALVVHQTLARSAAARHAILLWALIAAGCLPILNLAVRALGIEPPISGVLARETPSRFENLVAIVASSDRIQSPTGPSLGNALLVLWLAGSVLALIRLGRGLHITRSIVRNALPVVDEIPEPLLSRLSLALGRALPVILVSDRISVPLAARSVRPIVLLPAKLMDTLDDRQLLQVLIHECSHAIRRDPLVGLYQRLLTAAFWFHPLVHAANRMLDRAREELCDNRVLHVATPTEYSRTLLLVAESFSLAPNGLLAQTLFQSARQLNDRVKGLLNPRRCMMTQLKPWTIAAIALAFMGGGWALACLGAPAADRGSGYELSHIVRFKSGTTQFRGGDSITIDDVRGTSEMLSAGNTYIIKGTYRLASDKSATLAAFVTGDANDPQIRQMQNIPTQRTQSMSVDQGSGQFTLILYLWYDGNPHVSFYPADGGSSFGGIYFQNGDAASPPKPR